MEEQKAHSENTVMRRYQPLAIYALGASGSCSTGTMAQRTRYGIFCSIFSLCRFALWLMESLQGRISVPGLSRLSLGERARLSISVWQTEVFQLIPMRSLVRSN